MSPRARNKPPPELLTPYEVARRLAISLRTLYTLASRGIIPAPIRLTPKLVRWRVADIQRYLEQLAHHEKSRRPSA